MVWIILEIAAILKRLMARKCEGSVSTYKNPTKKNGRMFWKRNFNLVKWQLDPPIFQIIHKKVFCSAPFVAPPLLRAPPILAIFHLSLFQPPFLRKSRPILYSPPNRFCELVSRVQHLLHWKLASIFLDSLLRLQKPGMENWNLEIF